MRINLNLWETFIRQFKPKHFYHTVFYDPDRDVFKINYYTTVYSSREIPSLTTPEEVAEVLFELEKDLRNELQIQSTKTD